MASLIETFKLAQTFFIDRQSVKNAASVGLTAVDLFFKNKPSVNSLSQSLTGIVNPGIDVFICQVKENDIPDLSNIIPYGEASQNYEEIIVTSDASNATTFNFSRPVIVDTNKVYAIVVKVDGDDKGYDLWKSVEGDLLVGTVDRVAGPAGQYIGKYFDYIKNATNSTASWNPLNTTDLKFNVYCARYLFEEEITEPVFQGTSSFVLPKKPYEFFVYNRRLSSNTINVGGGDLVYQNSVVQPFTVSVRADSSSVFTSNGNFTTVYSANSADDQYIILFNGDGTRNIRQVERIMSNTEIIIDQTPTFTNTATTFSKAPVGVVAEISDAALFGTNENFLIVTDSNANASLRFTNNVIENITIVAGGSNYNNNDVIIVYNGANSTSNSEVNATAKLTTNSSGGIISTSLSNAGIGFFNLSPSFLVQNSVGGTSSGTSANLSFTIGASLLTEEATFANVSLINIGMNGISVGAVDFNNPVGTSYDLKLNHLYFGRGDNVVDLGIIASGTLYANGEKFTVTGTPTGTGASGYIRTDSLGQIVDAVLQSGGNNYVSSANVTIYTTSGVGANLEPIIGTFRYNASKDSAYTDRYISLLQRHNLPYSNTPQVMSRSYEVTQPDLTYVTATGQNVNTNVSSMIELIAYSNNEYTSPEIMDGEIDINYEKYVINNTYKNEHLGRGDAASKAPSVKINFSENRTAEDIRVYLRAYRPLGTDIKVFARIHNAKDPEAFDDKNWTLLECKDNVDVYSKLGDESSFVEYTYGFYQSPNTEFVATGVVTTTLNSSTITGANTNFATGTNSLAVNDLIKIYSPLFPENYMVSTVNSISSNTSLTITTPVSNTNVVGSGFKLDKLEYKNQAFNNILNGNVVRYHNSDMSEFDGYNTFALKLVFLSSSTGIVPKIDDTRGVGVTA